MDPVIKKLVEIDSASAMVLNHAKESKQASLKKMEKQMAIFDEKVKTESENRIRKMHADMEIALKEKLKKQREETQISDLEAWYEEKHGYLADKLFEEMIKE